MTDFVAEAPALSGRPIMGQAWRSLVFLHWAVDPAVVAPLLPRGVVPDVLGGWTYVGLVGFWLQDGGLGRGPAVPWLGSFAEVNVRLYSIDAAGTRGVVFRSLETTRLLVALGARATFGTPYMWTRIRAVDRPEEVSYETSRRLPGPRGAGGRFAVRPGAKIERPSPVEHFITARFGLHTRWLGRTLYIPNHHTPWPLHTAELLDLQDSLVAAAGFGGLTGRPPDSVLYSPGVRTEFAMPWVVRDPRVDL